MSSVLQNHYSVAAKKIYNKIVDWYIDSYWEDATDLDWILRFECEFPSSSRLCDMASGPGNFSRHLRPDFHEVTCVDISEQMIAAALRKLPSVHGIVADMRKVPIGSAYFDGILCAYSLNHIVKEEIDVVLKEFRRIIKNGGVMYLTLKEGEGRYEFGSGQLPDIKGIMELWDAGQLGEHVERHGFKVLATDRKSDVNENEFQHSKILLRCEAI